MELVDRNQPTQCSDQSAHQSGHSHHSFRDQQIQLSDVEEPILSPQMFVPPGLLHPEVQDYRYHLEQRQWFYVSKAKKHSQIYSIYENCRRRNALQHDSKYRGEALLLPGSKMRVLQAIASNSVSAISVSETQVEGLVILEQQVGQVSIDP